MTRRVLGILLLAVAGVSLAILSEAPYAATPPNRALIRLSWRAYSEQVQACRRLTPEELERLPIHMRQEEVCERTILPYRLLVSIDGTAVTNILVRSGGAREDRPLYVFHELPVAPGPHRLTIRFEREGEGETRDAAEPIPEREARETPPRLALDEVVVLGDRAVIVVTYDEEQRRLHVLAGREAGS
ncbi:MAG: hypothetical protein Q8Q14_07465 [Gemmatimonadales bacterium]|nr:hypothetical protein [Gemmatimonadales bacterium]